MKRSQAFFAIWATALLIVDCASAGLLQSIREAALLRDSLSETPRDPRALVLDQPPSNQVNTQLSFFESQTGKPACPPGDFLCIAQRNLKAGVQNEMSNAVVKSVAGMMTEMLNTTVTKGLFDIISNARKSDDPKVREEGRAAMEMAAGTMQAVSSKVIQAFAFFVKTSISGVMKDLFTQVVRAARSSPAFNSEVQSPRGQPGSQYYSYSTSADSVDAINPSNINNNNLKRAT